MPLTYYVTEPDGTYIPIYTYADGSIDPDEVYARQLCEYAVIQGRQYRLLSTEMEGREEILVVEDLGAAEALSDERAYPSGVRVEFREYRPGGDMPLLYTLEYNPYKQPHWHMLRYLLKDYPEVPTKGIYKRDSAEIDEDRRCYVLYVTPVEK